MQCIYSKYMCAYTYILYKSSEKKQLPQTLYCRKCEKDWIKLPVKPGVPHGFLTSRIDAWSVNWLSWSIDIDTWRHETMTNAGCHWKPSSVYITLSRMRLSVDICLHNTCGYAYIMYYILMNTKGSLGT